MFFRDNSKNDSLSKEIQRLGISNWLELITCFPSERRITLSLQYWYPTVIFRLACCSPFLASVTSRSAHLQNLSLAYQSSSLSLPLRSQSCIGVTDKQIRFLILKLGDKCQKLSSFNRRDSTFSLRYT